ncbi:FtsX-like permease family protein [Marinobacter sp. F4216]|uniref:FtsX-like permease family protein n=1 Tax=Marinobacter sp. F4216 TaxID=2874281 RepID=UPI001CBD7654|nr:ABC transporter permease [Marinobacter sp. F4216]MBZ2169745.1 ABC transporter permease [Marinobacter sp. F4216]
MNPFLAQILHYRRHPFQLLALVIMILVATMLWSAVSQLTAQARTSMGQSEQALGTRYQVQRADGQPVTVEDFVTLRRDGACVMPWLEVDSSTRAGRIVGIDPLSVACLADDTVPGALQGSPLDGQPFMDIGEAASLARTEPEAAERLYLIGADSISPANLPQGYRLTDFSTGPETGELGESFLLNLDALAVLVLLITALLLRSVHQLGMAQRRASFALLFRYGVTHSSIRLGLFLETLTLALVCVLPGVALGLWLANGLAGGFGQAMASLFDTPVYAGQGNHWLSIALVMAGVVLGVCLLDELAPRLTSVSDNLKQRQVPIAAGVLVLGLGLVWAGKSLPVVFLAVGLVFLGAGFLAPGMVAGIARWWARSATDPLNLWQYAELDVLARRLAFPLVALQFALALVLAVQALVTVFESTFDDWLSQRLAADYYVEVPPSADATSAASWLASRPDLIEPGAWHRVVRGRAALALPEQGKSQGIDVFSVGPVSDMLHQWRFLDAIDAPWAAFSRGEGLMVNEQLAMREAVSVGDTLSLAWGDQTVTLSVLAIYADYGRPAGEVLLPMDRLPETFSATFESLSVSLAAARLHELERGLKTVWQVEDVVIRDNGRIKTLAHEVFDQTFLLTRLITFVTLLLAAVSLLIMGWVFFSTRAWYYQLLTVWGLGQREVTFRLARLAVGLTGGIVLLALPLGIWLTWVLVHRINPVAFGWSLPMAVYPGFWLELGVLSLLIGLSIAGLMRWQLRHAHSRPLSASDVTGGER